MTETNTSFASLLQQKQAIEAQAAALQKQLDEVRSVERAATVDKIKVMMSENAITLSDLGFGRKTRSPNKTLSAHAGRKLPPKYRNPATDETWSGRGLQPKWIAAALASGKTLADFAI